MKQKNLILVVLAVGCGLVAAFLTANMSARPKQQAAVETIEIPSAIKDLPVGTKLPKEELEKYVVMKKINKDQAPPQYVSTLDELADKRLTRTLRPGDTFNPADLTAHGFLSPPPGHSVMTVRCTMDEGVAGFIAPGAKVDVLATVVMKKSQKQVVFPLFLDMLVLAVDSNAVQSPNGGAFANLSMVSFAVDYQTSLLLQAAISRGAMMRLALRHPDKPVIYPNRPTSEEIWDILEDRVEEKQAAQKKEPPKPELVKVKVATADLPVGTELSESVIKTKFKDAEFPAAFIPEGAVADLTPHLGKYLVRDLSANFFVPKAAIGEKPGEQGKEPEVAKLPEPEKARPVFVDMTVQTANSTKKFRYQKLENGEYQPIGEVPANLPDATEPTERKRQPRAKPAEAKPNEAKPQDEKKDESDAKVTPNATVAY